MLKKIEKVNVVGQDETVGEFIGTIIKKKQKSYTLIRDDNGQEQVAYRSMCTAIEGEHFARIKKDGSLELPVNPEITDKELAAHTEEKAKAVHLTPDMSRYSGHTVNDKKKLDIGDSVAEFLRDFELDEIFDLAFDLNLGSLKDRYSHLNPGMQRMNVGNRIRKVVADGNYETVKEAITGVAKMLEINLLVEGQGLKQVKPPKEEKPAKEKQEKAPKKDKKKGGDKKKK